jgi:predicted DsbA family dithiol-disulfide isomerase
LQRSLQEWKGQAITVEYKPFFLDPSVPPEGMDFRERLNRKAGGRFPIQHFFDAPREMGKAIGLTFNFEAIQRAPSTMLSHCLIELTAADQVEEVIEEIYAAYFEHGQDIGSIDVLLEIAKKHGMDAPDLRVRLLEADTRARVQEQVQQAYWLGIHAVPFFVIDQKYGFSGAQPPEVITQILEQVQKEKS